MAKRVIASSIDSVQLAQVAHDVVAERWDNWDLTEFLVYLVDTVDASVLPYLADQFNVEGLRGFSVASSELEQRELIKKAIALHKRIGTPWAIKEACRSVGFPIIILDEGVTEVPGGPADPETDWARFRVFVSTDNENSVTPEMMNKIRAFINIYKPERSHLQRLGFYQELSDGTVFAPLDDGVRKREILELQIIGNTGNLYVGGIIANSTPQTDTDVENLLIVGLTNPVLYNASRGSIITYKTPIGIMRSYIAVPSALNNITSMFDEDNEQELEDILIQEQDQIIINSINYTLYYLQYIIPATGEKTLKITV